MPSEVQKSPVGSVLIGAFALASFYSISYFTLPVVVLLSAAVGIISYFRTKLTPLFVLGSLAIPATDVVLSSQVSPGGIPYQGLVIILLFLAAFVGCLIDWLGSLVGIFLGMMMGWGFSPALVLPAIAVLSALKSGRAGASALLLYSAFGTYFIYGHYLGYDIPVSSAFGVFFPSISDLSSLYFPSLLLGLFIGSGWQEWLSSSSARYFIELTPFYFAGIGSLLIIIAAYGRKIFNYLGLNAHLTRIIASAVGTVVGGFLIFGSLEQIGISALWSVVLPFAFLALRPIFRPRPQLSSSGLIDLFSWSPLYDAKGGSGTVVDARSSKSSDLKYCWERVKGLDNIKNELLRGVALPIKYKKEASRFGVKPARGILLYGPPGTGKTTLLRGLAFQLGVRYYEVSLSELLSKWYGESEHRISELFSSARENAPCILAINDIDSIGKDRTMYKSDDVTPRLMNVLLSELDSINQHNIDVIVVATTNKPQLLDRALIRPGRFDKIIYVPPPGKDARREIFKCYLEGKPVAPGIDYDRLAELSERFTGADIEALVNKIFSSAFYEGLKNGKSATVTQELLEEAVKGTRPSVDYSMLEEYERFRVEFERDRRVTKTWESGIPEVTFDDIGDLDDVKAELREAFELPIRRPDLMERLRVRAVKGVLLYGPPGCGKTLLAKAIANEVEANFFPVSGAELSRGNINEAAAKINDVFRRAKDNAPAIVFIDEIDQIAPDRSYAGSSAFVPVTTQLLSELDGIHDLKGVMVLAATNRQEAIDPALLRANRIEKHIYVGLPDARARGEIIKVHLRDAPLGMSVVVDEIAKMTEGFSGAELQELVNEAKKSLIRATLKGEIRDALELEDFLEALRRIRGSLVSKSKP
ncbi:MAG: AAA family ATPase [Candidatus Methanosuratincola petrocarbonis]